MIERNQLILIATFSVFLVALYMFANWKFIGKDCTEWIGAKVPVTVKGDIIGFTDINSGDLYQKLNETTAISMPYYNKTFTKAEFYSKFCAVECTPDGNRCNILKP